MKPNDAMIARVALGGVHETLANCHPSLSRGQAWCRGCGYAETVSSSHVLKHGWPKHCGATMTIDSPAEQQSLATKDEAK